MNPLASFFLASPAAPDRKSEMKLRYFQSGQIFILALIVLTLVTVSTIAIISGSLTFFQNSKYTLEAIQALNLAEAGIDKAVATLNASGGSYSGEEETFLGVGSYSVSVSSKDAGTKIITATGYIPNKSKPKVKRTVKIQASTGLGVAFVYGIQVGEGGLELGNSNKVIGSIYSNGNVIGNNSNEITGDVWVAGGLQPTPDQQTDCQEESCSDFMFGKNDGGENRLDIAQSFKPITSNTLNKISLKLKKFGNPTNFAVRILKDDNGKPDKSQVLTSGILYSSLVSNSYGWTDVTFSSSPNLNSGSTYWVMVDTSSNSTNYWFWQNDFLQSYTRGSPAWSPNWQASNPMWNNFSGDLSFKTYMDGVTTKLSGGNNFEVGGDVHANTIENIEIEGDAYYQVISDSNVDGISYPGSADPPPKVFPISEANILDWKQQAENAGVSSGDISTCISTLGPGKIVGNVTFNNNCNIIVKSPVFIEGNLILNNSNTLTLSPEFGATSGVIVVDGTIDFGNSNKLLGTGQGSSLLMALSTYDSRANGVSAIRVNNSGNSGVLYADKGIIEPGNSNSFKELTAWKIRLMNSTTITYETGLSSVLFSSGPTGSISVIKGTYQSQ